MRRQPSRVQSPEIAFSAAFDAPYHTRHFGVLSLAVALALATIAFGGCVDTVGHRQPPTAFRPWIDPYGPAFGPLVDPYGLAFGPFVDPYGLAFGPFVDPYGLALGATPAALAPA